MHSNTHTHTLLPFLEWFLCFEVGKGKSLDSVYEILRNRMNRELKIETKDNNISNVTNNSNDTLK